MTTSIVVGLDGSASGERAVAYAKQQAAALGSCKIILCYVIEWSPYTFQTPQENEERHKRREQEISVAKERVLAPALKALKDAGLDADGMVRHGDAAEIIDTVAVDENASQIIVGRVGERGLRARIFGGVTGNLVASASVPVTVVP